MKLGCLIFLSLDEWCEYYSMNEGDSPLLNYYFAQMFIHLIRDGVLSLARINEALLKDQNIDNKRKGNQYGRRAEFLAYTLQLEAELSFSPEDWGLTQEQIEPLKEHYVPFFK